MPPAPRGDRASTSAKQRNTRILALEASNTWPDGWAGHEVRGDRLIVQVIADGLVQPLPGAANDRAREREEEGHATTVVAAQRQGGRKP
jgi:hypothetical protein